VLSPTAQGGQHKKAKFQGVCNADLALAVAVTQPRPPQ
jgi:hypothetical protein